MPSPKPESKKREQSALAKSYLILYNSVLTVGWSVVFYKLLTHQIGLADKGVSLYENVKWSLIVFQNAAVLEILHAATGIVPSNVMITIQQVASRVMLVCGVLIPTVAAKETFGLPLALLAWSITEIIRYGYYTANLVGLVPQFLVWLRYTTFIILYPIGVTGELLCLYAAQQEVSSSHLWTIQMPNYANFTFNYSYLLIFVMAIYVPLFPPMYLHMFAQRKKILGGQDKSKKVH